MGVVGADGQVPPQARLRARARDAPSRRRRESREVGDSGHDVLLFVFAGSGELDGDRLTEGTSALLLEGERAELVRRLARDLARARHARRRHRPARADGAARARRRDRTPSSRARRPAAARSRSSSARTTGAAARRCSSATCRRARRRGTTTSTTRSCWIWRGPGRYHLGDDVEPLADGTAFRITPRQVHIVENIEPRPRARDPRHLHARPGRRRLPTCSRTCPRRTGSGRRERERVAPRRRGRPRRVPDLRAHDLPQLVLAGRPLAPRARRVRGVPRRLGRERRRVGVLGGAGRGGARRIRRAPARRARRGRGDDLGLAGRERDRVGAAVRARRPHAHRDQRVRVPDGRPDRPRTGAARCRGRARAPRGRRLDPGGEVRRGDRRAHGARLLHDDLVSHRAPQRCRRDRRGGPRERRPRPRRQLPGGGRDRARRPGARRGLRHGRHGEVPARLRRARLPLGEARAARGAAPDPDRLVRRRGHLPDGHLRLLAARDRPALRRGDAAGAEHLRRRRRPRACCRRPACRPSRRTSGRSTRG